jgi:hypothetical protein
MDETDFGYRTHDTRYSNDKHSDIDRGRSYDTSFTIGKSHAKDTH